MANKIKVIMLNIYSNFMKFTFDCIFVNFFATLIENITIVYVIDYMINENILSQVFTPLYFLSPHIYLDFINERFTNECGNLLHNNPLDHTAKLYGFIQFFNNTLLDLDRSFCVYSDALIYFASVIVGIIIIFFVILGLFNSRGKQSYLKNIILSLLTNFNNIMIRPLSIIFLIILFNNPITMFYNYNDMSKINFSLEITITIFSILFLLIFIAISIIYIKYINNAYYFEHFPYDYYSKSDGLILLLIKVLVAFQINLAKFNGYQYMFFINLMIGLFIFIRIIVNISNRRKVINNLFLVSFTNFLSFFSGLYIILKLINQSFNQMNDYLALTITTEMALFAFVLGMIIIKLFYKEKKNS
jgi:hypothetical protein